MWSPLNLSKVVTTLYLASTLVNGNHCHHSLSLLLENMQTIWKIVIKNVSFWFSFQRNRIKKVNGKKMLFSLFTSFPWILTYTYSLLSTRKTSSHQSQMKRRIPVLNGTSLVSHAIITDGSLMRERESNSFPFMNRSKYRETITFLIFLLSRQLEKYSSLKSSIEISIVTVENRNVSHHLILI